MAEGNGVDIGAVYGLLQAFMEETRTFRQETQSEFKQLRAEMNAGFERVDAEVGDLRADVGGLREAVTHYHSAVLGRGVLISELDDRVRRIERHPALPPIG